MDKPKKYAVISKETEISHSHYASRREAEKVAKEMTDYHQREYVVREIPEAIRDCLGRPLRAEADPPAPPRRILDDERILAIANDVRTKPIAEVGRHVMPLIQHISALDERMCQNCRHWVAYNNVEASRGECLVHAAEGSAIRLSGDATALLTPFDWSCKGWEERLPIASDAQCFKAEYPAPAARVAAGARPAGAPTRETETMIYTRWGSEVRITGYCGKHEVDGYCDRLMLVRAVRQADQLERYYLAVTLKADGGINEVEAAIDAAPAVTLHGSELYDAIQQAM